MRIDENFVYKQDETITYEDKDEWEGELLAEEGCNLIVKLVLSVFLLNWYGYAVFDFVFLLRTNPIN